MTDEFNFLGLPLVVQDLITNEIVHQSIPEDRMQLASTSQYCNYLVQRAKPKKIMDRFTILSPLRFTCRSNSRKIPKKQQLMKIVSNCQIKKVVMADETKRDHSNYAEFFNMLFEAAKFSTKFDIIAFKDVHMVEIVGFYTKLKHLRSVTIGKPEFTLPYYPSKVKLNFHPSDYFLRDLAEKSRNCPLSVLKLECGVNLFGVFQEFLQTAKFSIGAEIRIRFPHRAVQIRFPHCAVHLTYLGQNIFTLEVFSNYYAPFIHPRYSAEMESAFPTADFTKPEERFEKINNVLGTNIQLIQVDNFDQTEEIFRKIRDSEF